jgi:hypothetical protein
VDPFGGSTGRMDELSSQGLSNDFNNIPANGFDTFIDNDRVQPRQVASGVMRGTQRIQNVDGSYITLGEIPGTDGEFGFGFFDRDGNLIKKSTGTTDVLYNNGSEVYELDDDGFTFSDATDRRIRLGKDPDSTSAVGHWMSRDGIDVIDELTA